MATKAEEVLALMKAVGSMKGALVASVTPTETPTPDVDKFLYTPWEENFVDGYAIKAPGGNLLIAYDEAVSPPGAMVACGDVPKALAAAPTTAALPETGGLPPVALAPAALLGAAALGTGLYLRRH